MAEFWEILIFSCKIQKVHNFLLYYIVLYIFQFNFNFLTQKGQRGTSAANKQFNFIEERKRWMLGILKKIQPHEKMYFKKILNESLSSFREQQNKPWTTKQQTTPFCQQGLCHSNGADLFQGTIGLMSLELRCTRCNSKPLSFQMKKMSNLMLRISRT